MSIDLSQYGFPTADGAKAQLLEAMGDYGIVTLEAHYAGGNDEGGVDDIQAAKDKDGNDVPLDDVGWQHPLWRAADEVLSSEFGSWAGDFSAYGVLYADAKSGKVHRSGEMSSYDEDGHTY